MKVKIYRIPFEFFHVKGVEFQIWKQGYILLDKNTLFNEQECWELTNWSCYSKEKPKNLFSDIEVSNADIIFHNPTNNRLYLALPQGWKVFKDLFEIKDFCLNYHNK